MPQMAPLNWTFLLIFFISILVIFFILNFYLQIKTKSSKTSYTLSKKNWKW